MAANKLKPYLAYSRQCGHQEEAVLVIAHSAKDARKLAWRHCLNVDEWIDQAATLIREPDILALADQAKLERGEPHVMASPEHCVDCGLWGCGLTSDDLCASCNCYPGDKLMARYARKGKDE